MCKHAIGVCLTLWMSAGYALAQGGASMRITGPPASGNFSRHHFDHPVFAGFPYWTDFVSPSEATPSVIVVQTPVPPSPNPSPKSEETKSAAPLMIEWQGDRYVRRTAHENSRADQPDYIAEEKPSAQNRHKSVSSRMDSKPSPRSLTMSSQLEDQTIDQAKKPPTTFIFRDGHHEQSSDYSIISGVIYARGDYWMTGHWSRQIRLSDLDLPATIQANQAQGIQFRLPTAPNQIITRP